jgi:hypothetical protein
MHPACPLGANFYDVRFTPESDRLLHCREVTLCAISDQSAVQQNRPLFDHLVGAHQAPCERALLAANCGHSAVRSNTSIDGMYGGKNRPRSMLPSFPFAIGRTRRAGRGVDPRDEG